MCVCGFSHNKIHFWGYSLRHVDLSSSKTGEKMFPFMGTRNVATARNRVGSSSSHDGFMAFRPRFFPYTHTGIRAQHVFCCCRCCCYGDGCCLCFGHFSLIRTLIRPWGNISAFFLSSLSLAPVFERRWYLGPRHLCYHCLKGGTFEIGYVECVVDGWWSIENGSLSWSFLEHCPKCSRNATVR